MTKKEAKSAISALIYDNPTWSDERIWAALKEAGYDSETKVLIGDVRYAMGAKDTWEKSAPKMAAPKPEETKAQAVPMAAVPASKAAPETKAGAAPATKPEKEK
jgi:hypothetical protein